MSPPVLITSSVIAQDPGVRLADSTERLNLTLESVGEWLKIDPHIKLVICDGSNYDFAHELKNLYPGANIESLCFLNDSKLVQTHGRGYGEGEIVKYAVNNSRYISESESFVKCTAKLWVQNYKQCIADWTGGFKFKAVFLNVFSLFKQIQLLQIDTRFYIASKQEYLQLFENAHLFIDKEAGHGLEDCFLDIILRNQIKPSFLNVYPVICGTGGGTGVPYKHSFTRRIKENLRLKIAQRSSSYREYFN